jgi:hypothetical protein
MGKKPTSKPVEEIDLLDDMLTALVDLLEEKGLLTHEEWEGKIKQKLKERRSAVDFRDMKGEEDVV